MMRDRRRVVMMRHLVLSSYDNGKSVHNGDHNPFVGAASSLHWVTSPSLLIGHGASEDRPLRVYHDCRSCGGCVTLGAFEESHHVGFDGIRFAHGWCQIRLVLVGVRVVALHWDRVTHVGSTGRDHVRETLDRVRCVHFVTGHARHFVHADWRSLREHDWRLVLSTHPIDRSNSTAIHPLLGEAHHYYHLSLSIEAQHNSTSLDDV